MGRGRGTKRLEHYSLSGDDTFPLLDRDCLVGLEILKGVSLAARPHYLEADGGAIDWLSESERNWQLALR